MSQRTYHSIGDVLTLLRAEFPDVTISKIRFLESQGLVNPQRSPSGYRKFYDEDIERLRYVLVQQREHFLPLKVIRDRLNGEESIDSVEESVIEEETVVVSVTSTTVSVVSRTAVQTLREEVPSGESMGSISHIRAKAKIRDNEDPKDSDPNLVRPVRVAAKEPSMADVVSALQEAPKRPVSAEVAKPKPNADHSVPPEIEPDPEVHGETLTTEELAAKLKVDEKYIDELVDFGVITPVTIGGMTCFDDESVSVAGIAAGFAAFGIEPRHLRQFRTSVDKELGLIDQIVAPLLRQRNPEARAQALATAKELASLGRDMRATLIAQELRKSFAR